MLFCADPFIPCLYPDSARLNNNRQEILFRH